jgi:hypothetical protein
MMSEDQLKEELYLDKVILYAASYLSTYTSVRSAGMLLGVNSPVLDRLCMDYDTDIFHCAMLILRESLNQRREQRPVQIYIEHLQEVIRYVCVGCSFDYGEVSFSHIEYQ